MEHLISVNDQALSGPYAGINDGGVIVGGGGGGGGGLEAGVCWVYFFRISNCTPPPPLESFPEATIKSLCLHFYRISICPPC